MIRLEVGTHIRISGLTPGQVGHWQRMTTFDNPKHEASARFTYNRKPDRRIAPTIPLWSFHGDDLVLPRGILDDVLSAHNDPDGTDNTVLPQVPLQTSGALQPREYQTEAVEAVIKAGSGVVVAGTGTGKTIIALHLAERLRTPTLILVHTRTLLDQTADRIREWLGVEPGIIGGGKWEPRTVTVATVQTIAKRGPCGLDDYFGVVAQDECFPAGTIVDGRPIDDLRPGDRVTTFDPSTFTWSQQRISAVMLNRPTRLLTIETACGDIVCTPSHPFLTPEGWISAIDLQVGDLLARNPEETDGCLCNMRETSGPGHQVAQGSSPQDGTGILQSRMRHGVEAPCVVSDDGKNQSPVRLRANAHTQPNAQSRSSETNVSDKTWSPMDRGAGRQRPAASCCASGTCGLAGLGDGGDCPDGESTLGKETSKRHTIALQTGHCGTHAEDCNRGGRRIASQPGGSSRGCAQGSVLAWCRVDRIEVHEPGSDGRFGGLCPDGKVYNIEVTGPHTYVANGFVVHNCHHVPAETFARVMQMFRARYRVGLTATPKRSDHLEPILFAVIGPIVYQLQGTSLPLLFARIDTGWTIKELPRRKNRRRARPGFQLEGKPKDDLDYVALVNAVCADPGRNALVVETILREHRGTSLVLTERVAHVRVLTEALTGRGLKAVALAGDVAKVGRKTKRTSASLDERNDAIDGLNSGRYQVLVSTPGMVGEGFDCPRIDTLFLACPHGLPGKAEQTAGRTTRPYQGKKHGRVIDFVDEAVEPLYRQWWKRQRVYRRLRGE